MTKIFAHRRAQNGGEWLNDIIVCDRVPAMGEYVAIDGEATLFQVKHVIHIAFSADFEAEIFFESAATTLADLIE